MSSSRSSLSDFPPDHKPSNSSDSTIGHSRIRSFTRERRASVVNDDDDDRSSSSVRVSRPFSTSLFGGVRSNVKPGAALAAAAAASRSVPTPHAAAIKWRRSRLNLDSDISVVNDNYHIQY